MLIKKRSEGERPPNGISIVTDDENSYLNTLLRIPLFKKQISLYNDFETLRIYKDIYVRKYIGVYFRLRTWRFVSSIGGRGFFEKLKMMVIFDINVWENPIKGEINLINSVGRIPWAKT